MNIEMVDKIIDDFYYFCRNHGVVETHRNYSDDELTWYSATFSPYHYGNFHTDPDMITNYMLCIVSDEQWDYDIFADSIDIGTDQEFYDYNTIDIADYDLTQNLEELAFQLSTVYNLGCSTEQFIKILEIAQFIRDNGEVIED